ncbi:MAG: PilZ domain-containing protein [Firmicutes bacterium]|nr:PilZ domain-containing protein [Bacillota bacterium]
MVVVLAESALVSRPSAWWQRALVADGQSWIWVGTLVISLVLIAILALRYLWYLWWLHRIRLLRGQGLISSSELRRGQCAYLQLLDGSEEERLRRWRTMVRAVHPSTVDVDMPMLAEGERFVPGARVALAVNAIDSLYVMETEVVGVESGEPCVLRLRRQPLLHRLQRRQFARVELMAPATIEIVGGKSIGRYTGVILDIGGGGVCVQAPVAPVVGSTVCLEVPTLSEVLPASTRLTVVGVSETVVDGHLEYRLHCAFADLSAEQHERVARYVHRKQHESVTERRWRTPQEVGTQHYS